MDAPSEGLQAGMGLGAASRAPAEYMLRQGAARKRREADQLDALADLAKDLKGPVEEALWSVACGYLR